jgi:hypothetical protein
MVLVLQAYLRLCQQNWNLAIEPDAVLKGIQPTQKLIAVKTEMAGMHPYKTGDISLPREGFELALLHTFQVNFSNAGMLCDILERITKLFAFRLQFLG